MSWKQDLLGQINSAIRQRQDATFAVHDVEQKEFGERMLGNIFSTLHLNKPLKLDFKIIPIADQDKISVGDILEHKGNDAMSGERVFHEEHGAGNITFCTYVGPKPVYYIMFDGLEDEVIIDRDDPKLRVVHEYARMGKLEYEKELERIQADSLAEAKEIEDMSHEILVDKFEDLIRNGAGPGYRRVVFMKKEMLKRMNRR